MAEGVVWERLAATPEHGVNFMKITYAPGAASADGDLITHDGYEYGYVLSGEVAVTVGDEVFQLHPGESLGFDSSIPHVLRNLGHRAVRGHLVRARPASLTPRSYAPLTRRSA